MYICLTQVLRKTYAKLQKNTVQQFIHLYMATTANQKTITKKYNFIEQWLPARYTKDVNLILKEHKAEPSYIRQVKKERIHNKKIMDALYAVAKLNKLQLEN